NRGDPRKYFRAMRKQIGMVRDPPYNNHKNSQQRRVGVAIGHCLTTNLNKSNHRHQATEVPQPSGNQKTLAEMSHAEKRERENKGQTQEWFPQRESVLRMGIKNCQVKRPKTFEDIEEIGPERVGGSSSWRNELIGGDGIGTG